jgi:hypothetical protein
VGLHSLKRVRSVVRQVIDGTTIGRRLLAALGHPIVANEGTDTQAIVSEHALAASRLRGAVTSTDYIDVTNLAADLASNLGLLGSWKGRRRVGQHARP